jgi:hypothetical protein
MLHSIAPSISWYVPPLQKSHPPLFDRYDPEEQFEKQIDAPAPDHEPDGHFSQEDDPIIRWKVPAGHTEQVEPDVTPL